jgi:hypothetical protein
MPLESLYQVGQFSVALRQGQERPQTGKGLGHLRDGAISTTRNECKSELTARGIKFTVSAAASMKGGTGGR